MSVSVCLDKPASKRVLFLSPVDVWMDFKFSLSGISGESVLGGGNWHISLLSPFPPPPLSPFWRGVIVLVSELL